MKNQDHFKNQIVKYLTYQVNNLNSENLSELTNRNNFISTITKANGLCFGLTTLWAYAKKTTATSSSAMPKDDYDHLTYVYNLLANWDEKQDLTLKEKKEINYLIEKIAFYHFLDPVKKITHAKTQMENLTTNFEAIKSNGNLEYMGVKSIHHLTSFDSYKTTLENLLQPNSIFSIGINFTHPLSFALSGHEVVFYTNADGSIDYYDPNLGEKTIHTVHELTELIWQSANYLYNPNEFYYIETNPLILTDTPHNKEDVSWDMSSLEKIKTIYFNNKSVFDDVNDKTLPKHLAYGIVCFIKHLIDNEPSSPLLNFTENKFFVKFILSYLNNQNTETGYADLFNKLVRKLIKETTSPEVNNLFFHLLDHASDSLSKTNKDQILNKLHSSEIKYYKNISNDLAAISQYENNHDKKLTPEKLFNLFKAYSNLNQSENLLALLKLNIDDILYSQELAETGAIKFLLNNNIELMESALGQDDFKMLINHYRKKLTSSPEDILLSFKINTLLENFNKIYSLAKTHANDMLFNSEFANCGIIKFLAINHLDILKDIFDQDELNVLFDKLEESSVESILFLVKLNSSIKNFDNIISLTKKYKENIKYEESFKDISSFLLSNHPDIFQQALGKNFFEFSLEKIEESFAPEDIKLAIIINSKIQNIDNIKFLLHKNKEEISCDKELLKNGLIKFLLINHLDIVQDVFEDSVINSMIENVTESLGSSPEDVLFAIKINSTTNNLVAIKSLIQQHKDDIEFNADFKIVTKFLLNNYLELFEDVVGRASAKQLADFILDSLTSSVEDRELRIKIQSYLQDDTSFNSSDNTFEAEQIADNINDSSLQSELANCLGEHRNETTNLVE